MGRPAINTVFNNTQRGEGSGQPPPTLRRPSVRPGQRIATLTAIDTSSRSTPSPTTRPPQIAGMANVLTPDTLTVKLGNSAGFLNGRKLSDDVIDTEFSVLTDGNITSDGVNANDRDVPDHVPLPRRTALTARPGRPPAGPGRTHRHERAGTQPDR